MHTRPFACHTARNFFFSRFFPKPLIGKLLIAALALGLSAQALANPNFAVTVNPGPTPPNATTVYPGEPTSLRIILSNNSTVTAINNANFTVPLPSTATGGLRVNGPSTISGAGCAGGVLNTAPGDTDISLSGLMVPARIDGEPNSGECYLDIPIVA